MKVHIASTLLMLVVSLTSCNSHSIPDETKSLKEERALHTTVLTTEISEDRETIIPPKDISLSLVKYDSDGLSLDAYISKNPTDGEKHPLVIWLSGGWSNSISDFYWLYNTPTNDQSGAILRDKGILMMYPSFRGGNQNDGYKESFYGEIDDIYNAYEYAKSLDYVDENRIYLIGHSTGGTKALLASEYDDKFRAIFAFGPVDEVASYGKDNLTFDLSDETESYLRSPINWLENIKTPTYIIEGEFGNSLHLGILESNDKNDFTEYFSIKGADHFNYIFSITNFIGDEILKDTEKTPSFNITKETIENAFNSDPIVFLPEYATKTLGDTGLHFDIPAYWDIDEISEYEKWFYDANIYYDEEEFNFWSGTEIYLNAKPISTVENFGDEKFYELYFNDFSFPNYEKETINGIDTYWQEGNINSYYIKVLVFHDDDYFYEIYLDSRSSDMESSKILTDKIINSISF